MVRSCFLWEETGGVLPPLGSNEPHIENLCFLLKDPKAYPNNDSSSKSRSYGARMALSIRAGKTSLCSMFCKIKDQLPGLQVQVGLCTAVGENKAVTAKGSLLTNREREAHPAVGGPQLSSSPAGCAGLTKLPTLTVE